MKTPNGMVFQDQAGYDAEMARIKRLGLDHNAKQGSDDDPDGSYAFRHSIFSQYQGKPPVKAQSAPARTDDPSGTFAFREAIFAGGRR